MPEPGATESEFGVPIPGRILPEADWARTAIKRLPPPGPIDWPAVFGRAVPLVVELGCGNARYTLQSAIARPDKDHVAVDVLPVVIRYATRRANQRGLANSRFIVRDAETFVAEYLAEETIDEVHLYHPQPYHDPRMAHLRLVTPRFLADVHRALRPGGLFVTQTDNPDYWDYIRRIAPVFFAFEDHPDPWPDAPDGRSRREILSRSRNVKIFRGLGRRLEAVSRPAALKLADTLPAPTFRTRGPWCDLDDLEVGGGRGDETGPSQRRPGRGPATGRPGSDRH